MRAASEAHARDLAAARELRDAAAARLARLDASAVFVHERVSALDAGSEVCSICMDAPSSVITPCAHLFCGDCARRHLQTHAWCPTCRAPLRAGDLAAVARGAATKLAHIAALLAGLAAADPVILFVQWKAMVRGMRAYLRGAAGAPRVLLLEGNTLRRAATLSEFTRRGGVLLLCLEDSFAGLHLPQAKHVVFAHAIVADRERVGQLERQAIARCVRPGQTDQVRVHSFVVAEGAEERVWHDTRAAAGS